MGRIKDGEQEGSHVPIGKEMKLRSKGLCRVLITYPDGSEIEFLLRPNDEARVKKGSQMDPNIEFIAVDEDFGDLSIVQ